MEWAGRGLTFWWLKRRYPEEMRLRDRKALLHQQCSQNSPSQQPRSQSQTENSDPQGVELSTEDTAPISDFPPPETLQQIDDEERDFFQRELDRLGWGLAALSSGNDDVAFGEEAPGVSNAAYGSGNAYAGAGAGAMNGVNGSRGGEVGGLSSGSTGAGAGVGTGAGPGGTVHWDFANAGPMEAWQQQQGQGQG